MKRDRALLTAGDWARIGSQTGISEPIRTRHGVLIDRAMVGEEMPMPPGSRWQSWAAHPDPRRSPAGLARVWVSHVYIVQLFTSHPRDPWDRLSIRRIDGAEIRERWDELQAIKNETVGEHVCAVECFPSESDLVNVARMRHLFLVPDGYDLPCLWRTSAAAKESP